MSAMFADSGNFNMIKNKGFTLIELLVVIAIIGILASVVLASLNSARSKARDARRKSDLKEIHTAMELYLDDHGGVYPGVQGFFSNRDVGGNSNINVLQPTYISTVPDDPQHIFGSGVPTYLHMTKDYTDGIVNAGSCSGLVLQSSDKFSLYAKLENPSAADIATLAQGDSYDQCIYQTLGVSHGYNYRVGN